jgi:hypothetical protein
MKYAVIPVYDTDKGEMQRATYAVLQFIEGDPQFETDGIVKLESMGFTSEHRAHAWARHNADSLTKETR